MEGAPASAYCGPWLAQSNQLTLAPLGEAITQLKPISKCCSSGHSGWCEGRLHMCPKWGPSEWIWASQVLQVVKNLPAGAGDVRDVEFIPWVGKIPLKRAWQPTPSFLPVESHGQRSLAGHSPWSRTEWDWNVLARTHQTILFYNPRCFEVLFLLLRLQTFQLIQNRLLGSGEI